MQIAAAADKKIVELEELPAKLAELRRRRDRRVVQCHGVFDLLHVGHIRHFAEAKAIGDLLVVTVTPDCYVNKGPHRPAFPERLRAESIAALASVDYVAINRWPTAVEAIQILRPDFYVKGPDYCDTDRDVTGAIKLEQRAVEQVGGALVRTDERTFSSTELINRYFSSFSPQIQAYLKEFATRHRAAQVLGYLESLRALSVLVIGEAIIDEYQYCEAIGKSSKDPMLAIRHVSTERFAGGILAVGNHIADFCNQIGLISLLGERDQQEDFVREKLDPRIDITLLRRARAPTLVKRRFIESYSFTKMLEVYEMDDRELEGSDQDRLCQALAERVPGADVVIVVDFGHGMLNRQAIRLIEDRARFLAVNVQSNAANLGYHAISKYHRADYVCFTENEMRLEARDRHGDPCQQIIDICTRLGARDLTVTKGRNGCLCYRACEGFVEAPALAGQVVDRMGAGDAVMAITAPCVALRVPMEAVAFIANVVGAQAVAGIGNRTPTRRAALYKHIESLLKQ
jgi:rfaE bifunctional protein nucleotidyltransferase chain/domain